MDKNVLHRAMKPDAQAFDEVRIVTVPRYKMSGLSGDEWRISAKIQLLRKGNVVHEQGCGNIEVACALLPGIYYHAIDDGKAYFGGEGDICDQEGCKEPAVVTYRVKKSFSRDNPHKWNEELTGPLVAYRCFCQKHSKRGDCGFDDSDSNYELVEGKTTNPNPEDESPSVFGGVIGPIV